MNISRQALQEIEDLLDHAEKVAGLVQDEIDMMPSDNPRTRAFALAPQALNQATVLIAGARLLLDREIVP